MVLGCSAWCLLVQIPQLKYARVGSHSFEGIWKTAHWFACMLKKGWKTQRLAGPIVFSKNGSQKVFTNALCCFGQANWIQRERISIPHPRLSEYEI